MDVHEVAMAEELMEKMVGKMEARAMVDVVEKMLTFENMCMGDKSCAILRSAACRIRNKSKVR